MICVHLHSVLLITPVEADEAHERLGAAGPWMAVQARTVGEALRQVCFYSPSVLIFDLSMLRRTSEESDRALQVISAVRRRSPGLSIVVLGPADDPSMEPVVRREGASIYLPVCEGHDRGDIQRVIHAVHARAGPNKTHGPPRSGVPPR